jgi:hypothetical protein
MYLPREAQTNWPQWTAGRWGACSLNAILDTIGDPFEQDP